MVALIMIAVLLLAAPASAQDMLKQQADIEALRRQLEENNPPPDQYGVTHPIYRYQTRLEKLRQDLADLRRRYSDRHPDVIRLKEEIEREIAAPTPAPSERF